MTFAYIILCFFYFLFYNIKITVKYLIFFIFFINSTVISSNILRNHHDNIPFILMSTKNIMDMHHHNPAIWYLAKIKKPIKNAYKMFVCFPFILYGFFTSQKNYKNQYTSTSIKLPSTKILPFKHHISPSNLSPNILIYTLSIGGLLYIGFYVYKSIFTTYWMNNDLTFENNNHHNNDVPNSWKNYSNFVVPYLIPISICGGSMLLFLFKFILYAPATTIPITLPTTEVRVASKKPHISLVLEEIQNDNYYNKTMCGKCMHPERSSCAGCPILRILDF